jgi:spore maturation protein CgeB
MTKRLKVVWLTGNTTPRWSGPYKSIVRDLAGMGLDSFTVGYYNICYIGHRFNPTVVDNISKLILPSFNPKAKLNKLARKINLLEIEKFAKFLSENHIDVVLTTGYFTGLHESTRKAGTKSILWSVDDTATHCPVWFEYASKFDYVLTYSKGSVWIYRRMGCSKVDWLPPAVDTQYYFPRVLPKLYDISFVGNNLADRKEGLEKILYPLMKHYQNFHLFGDGWSSNLRAKAHGPVDWRLIPIIYASSKIVATIHRDAHKLVEGTINPRVFEALGCRSFLLSDNPLGLDKLFENKKEIVIANNSEEALELAQFYLNESELSMKIATNGYEKVVKLHTTKHRARVLASIILRL